MSAREIITVFDWRAYIVKLGIQSLDDKESSLITPEQESEVLRWLAVSDPADLTSPTFQKMGPAIVSFLMSTDPFARWQIPIGSSFLCIAGSAGTGKTTLAASITKYLDKEVMYQERGIVAHFKFVFGSPKANNHRAMIASLSSQISFQSRVVMSEFWRLRRSSRDVFEDPPQDVLEDGLRNGLSNRGRSEESGPISIILDALDESENPRETVVWLANMLNEIGFFIRVLVTTRDEKLPSPIIIGSPAQTEAINIESMFHGLEVVQAYVHHRLHNGDHLHFNHQIFDIFESEIMKAPDGR